MLSAPVTRDHHAWRFVLGVSIVFPALMAVDVVLAGPPWERAREVGLIAVVAPLVVYFGLGRALRVPGAASSGGPIRGRRRRYGRVMTGTLAGVFVLFVGAKALEVVRRTGLSAVGEAGLALPMLAAVGVLGLCALRLRRLERADERRVQRPH